MRHPRKRIVDTGSAVIVFALVILDLVMARNIIADLHSASAKLYFLPVAEGESALALLPGGVSILTDAGSDGTVADAIQKVLPSNGNAYIDIAVISYPESADYDGYKYILKHYAVGAFVYDGRNDIVHSSDWQELLADIASRHIPLITMGAGDRIVRGNVTVDILSPNSVFARSADPTDAALVEHFVAPGFSALLASDIGPNVEEALISRGNLRSDVIKAPFPGVGTAAGSAFLRAVAPRTIVVMPGVKGAPSDPTKAMLAYLASSTAAAIVSPKSGGFLLYNE